MIKNYGDKKQTRNKQILSKKLTSPQATMWQGNKVIHRNYSLYFVHLGRKFIRVRTRNIAIN